MGEVCREQGAEIENCRFLVAMRVGTRSVTVTTSISSSASGETKNLFTLLFTTALPNKEC